MRESNIDSTAVYHTRARPAAGWGYVSRAVVIPTFEESESAPIAVQHVQAATGADVLVVDDSPDAATREAVETQTDAAVIDGPDEGLAAAILHGIRTTTAERVAVCDADLQHPPGTVAQLLEQLDDHDLAIGSRHLVCGGVTDEWPAHRRAISYGGDLLARAAVPQTRWVSDPMSGLFAVRRDLVAGRDDLDPVGYKALVEVLARCPVQRIVEVPFQFGDREYGSSKLDWREHVRFARHLVRLVGPSRSASVELSTASVVPQSPPEVTASAES